VTRWALLLLVFYLGLGLSPVARGKAMHLALGLTAAVLVVFIARAGASP